MNNKPSLFIKDTVKSLTFIVPVIFSMASCSGMGAFAGAVFACAATLICNPLNEKQQMPIYVSLLIITSIFKEYGASSAALSIVICGILLAVSSLFYNKIKSKFENITDASVSGTVMLSCAIIVTILFTTDYFGIGATGYNAKEMIESYLSLGFHPNWRGVLYGTIVMVVMITFPRKFKKVSGIISASFIALIITTVLNLFLNPSDMISAISEVGKLSFVDYRNNILLSLFKTKPSILISVLSGVSLFVTHLYALITNNEYSKKDLLACGVMNTVSGFATNLTLPCINKKEKFLSSLTAAITAGVMFLVLQDYIARIPVHSCAVIIIVGVWQSVNWKEIKKIFLSVSGVLIFTAVAVSSSYVGYWITPFYVLIFTLIFKPQKSIK